MNGVGNTQQTRAAPRAQRRWLRPDGDIVIDFDLRHAVAGLFGLLLAAIVLHPLLRGTLRTKALWVQVGAAAVALSLLIPVVRRDLRSNTAFPRQGTH